MSEIQHNSTLELSRQEMQSLGYKVVDILTEHFENLRNLPVTRKSDRSTLEKQLREPLPEQGSQVEQVLEQAEQIVFNNIMHLDHPRFFAFVPSPGNFVSVMADALVSGFNVFAGTWLEASGPAQIELVTIDWLRQLCGFPDTAGGLFVSGGSMAILTALATARHVRLRDNFQDAVVYCSDQTHASIDRGLGVMGFVTTQIRKLPSDDAYRLMFNDLMNEVAADRAAGNIPFCVIANAGTVNTGAVDPLPAIAKFCREEGLWLHIDGAYGAAAIFNDKGRNLLEGLAYADSLSIDPHKWLFQPYEIGCVLVRNSHWLSDTFHIMPEYLKDIVKREEEINYCDYGIQLTRGFRALKLWMSLKVFGLAVFREAVTRGFSLAELAEEILHTSAHWEITSSAQLGIVTFRFVPEDRILAPAELDALNQQIVDEMIADGFAMISTTSLRGRKVLRLCTINPRTTEEDIRDTIHKLENLGRRLSTAK
jgi:aromatic-L-amino-acid/L-tryptophan decarboxylase